MCAHVTFVYIKTAYLFTNIKYAYILVKSVKKINNYKNNTLSLQKK